MTKEENFYCPYMKTASAIEFKQNMGVAIQ